MNPLSTHTLLKKFWANCTHCCLWMGVNTCGTRRVACFFMRKSLVKIQCTEPRPIPVSVATLWIDFARPPVNVCTTFPMLAGVLPVLGRPERCWSPKVVCPLSNRQYHTLTQHAVRQFWGETLLNIGIVSGIDSPNF